MTLKIGSYAIVWQLTPPGPEGSNGTCLILCAVGKPDRSWLRGKIAQRSIDERRRGFFYRLLIMSYTVIARRYRPQTFDDVVGQEHITTTLKNAITEQKVSHAYLFFGSRGVGKTSMARILAKALNCVKGPTVNPCNKCEICRRIAEGTDADVIEMDAASNRGIDEIRSLRESVGYVPLRARYKVYIIDEAHQLTRESFNALLKTLEEPPPHVKFILATTELNKLPGTIISRCQRFNFHRLTSQNIFNRLQQVCQREKVKVEPGVLASVARMAFGSMRDAESMLDQLISYAGKQISESDLEVLMGIVQQNEIFVLLDSIHDGQLAGIVKVCHDIFVQGKSISLFLDQIISHLRYLILILAGTEQSELLADEVLQDRERYLEQAKKFNTAFLMAAIDQLVDTRQKMKDTSNARVLLELALFKITQMATGFAGDRSSTESRPVIPLPAKQPVPPSRASKNNPTGENKAVSSKESNSKENTRPIKKEISASDLNSSAATKTTVEIKNLWPEILVQMKENSQRVYALIREGRLIKADEEEVLVGFGKKYSFHRNLLQDVKFRQVVEEYIEKVSGRKLALATTEIADEMLPEQPMNGSSENSQPTNQLNINSSPGRTNRGSDALSEMLQDPLIKKTLNEFEGRVVNLEE